MIAQVIAQVSLRDAALGPAFRLFAWAFFISLALGVALILLRAVMRTAGAMLGVFRPWWSQRVAAMSCVCLSVAAASALLAGAWWAIKAVPAIWAAACSLGAALILTLGGLCAMRSWRQAASRAHGHHVEVAARSAAKKLLKGEYRVRHSLRIPGRREDVDLVIWKRTPLMSFLIGPSRPICAIEIKSWTRWNLTDPRCRKAVEQNTRQIIGMRASFGIIWLPSARNATPIQINAQQWVARGGIDALRATLRASRKH